MAVTSAGAVIASTVDFFQAAPEAEAFVVCYLTNELATHPAI